MSVDVHVILNRGKLATPQQWRQAIIDNGFALELETGFEPEEHEGYLLCTYRGADSGFEYFFSELEEGMLDDETMQRIGTRDCVVTLTAHGDMDGLISSTIAAAVLCAISGGLLLDDASEELFVEADDAVEYARAQEAALSGGGAPSAQKSAVPGGAPEIEVAVTHEGATTPVDIGYMKSPRYQELRERQLEIFLALSDPEEASFEQLAELQALDRELEKLRAEYARLH